MDYPVKTTSQLRPLLKAFRKAAGLTQATMASHLGVTQQTYAQLELNPSAVSVERLFRVLRVLGVELSLAQTRLGPRGQAAAGRNVAASDQAPAVTRKDRPRVDTAGPAAKASRTTGETSRLQKQKVLAASIPGPGSTTRHAGAMTSKSRVAGPRGTRKSAGKAAAATRKREDW
jgi:HTH-type transcriptional regulator / antitoxin HipB